MKPFQLAGLCCLFLILVGAVADKSPVTQVERTRVDARYRSLGVTVPPDGIVLPDPYATPYSSRSFVVPPSWFAGFVQKARSGDLRISASALRADLPTLRFILENVYPGYKTAEERGWNWNDWFKRWDDALAVDGDKELPPDEALSPWGQLEDFQLDNHSRPLLPGFEGFSASALLDEAPSGACTSLGTTDGRTYPLSTTDAGQQPHAVQQWNGGRLSPAWYVAYPQREGHASSITCGGKSISLVATDQHRITVDKPVYQNLGGGLVYIRTPRSFFYREDEAFSKVLAAAPSSAERVVLLDLRSNGGGAAPIQMLRRWFSQDAIAQARSVGTTYTSESCFNTALQFNAGESLAATLTPPVAAQTRSLLQGMVDAIEATPPGHCSVKWKSRETPMPPAHTFTVSNTDPKQTRVIALVDNACGSDCEGLALILSHLPETVIAGTSTAGVMGFAQPGMFVLPNSRVPFMVALTLRDNYGDRRSVSGYGVPVDVLLPTAKSQQMDSLIALARALSH